MIGFGIDLVGITMIAFGNLDALNGTDNATETYNYEHSAAGSSIERQIKATRKYEKELDEIDERRDILTISGGVCLLGGGVLHLISYRWLKRACSPS